MKKELVVEAMVLALIALSLKLIYPILIALRIQKQGSWEAGFVVLATAFLVGLTNMSQLKEFRSFTEILLTVIGIASAAQMTAEPRNWFGFVIIFAVYGAAGAMVSFMAKMALTVEVRWWNVFIGLIMLYLAGTFAQKSIEDFQRNVPLVVVGYLTRMWVVDVPLTLATGLQSVGEFILCFKKKRS
jgi:hypothetical protein